MPKQPLNEQFAEELYLAAEHVQSGVYRQIGTNREIHLDNEGVLPASLDGRIACYVRVCNTWSQIQQQI